MVRLCQWKDICREDHRIQLLTFCILFRLCIAIDAFPICNDSSIVKDTGENGLKRCRVFMERCSLEGVLMHRML